MKQLIALSLVVSSLVGSVAQAQFVYPAPLVPVYPAPIVAYPAPVVPAPVLTPGVPVYPVAPACTYVTVPVSSWQWVQGLFGGWHLRWVTNYQTQLICR
ncbi:hypothetical protein EBR78_04970 [bacterium]|nr:hypothetical protein [bacterium]